MADIQANIGIGVDTSQALAAIRQLQREISVFHTLMAKGGAAAAAKSMAMQQGLINTINETGKFSASMTRISSSTESFTNALEKNKLSMTQYFRYAGGASKTFGKMFTREFNTINKVAAERVKDLQTQYISMGRDANGALQSIKVRPLALDMDNLGTRVQLAAQKQQIFNQLMKQGTTNLLNFGKNTQWAGRQLMVGFTIPLTIFGATAAREFQKLEEQAVKFRRVYGDMFTTDADTEKALANVRQLAEEFTKYGIAVEKTIGLAAKVAQMGNVGEDLTQQVTQATRLAVLGGMEQEEALDTTISLTNAFGIAAEDLAGKIAFLNAAENQTILSIEDFNEAIPKAGSVVQQLGGDVEDLAFFLTAMREGGINASQAANALKTSLARLIAPTEVAKKEMAGFGIDIVAIVENNAGNLKNTVLALGQELDKLDPLNRARAIEQLFGKFQFARMSTMFQNIVKEGSQARKILDLTANSTEELAIIAERELSRVEDSVSFKFQKQLEKLQAALAPIGEEFLKAITPVVEFGTRLLKAFNNLGDGGKQFVVILTTIAGVVAPAALMAFGLIANGVANLLKFFQFLGNAFGMLSGKSTMLGGQTEYMTQQQIEAAAVAASLGQSHSNLTQIFTAEASAVASLVAQYRSAIAAQRQLSIGQTARGVAMRPPGFAKGGIIRGPGTGTSDSIMAMISNGEAVIPAAQVKKYGPAVEQIISDNVPGYADGYGVVRTHASMPFATGSPQYQQGLESSGFSQIPAQLQKYVTVVSNLVAELPQSLNIALQKGTATVENFKNEWDSRQGKFSETARRGGLDISDSENVAALQQIENEIGERAVVIAQGTSDQMVNDDILAQATQELINKYRERSDALGLASSALYERSQTVGQVRLSVPKEEMQLARQQGLVTRTPGTTGLEAAGINVGRVSSTDENRIRGANPYRPSGSYSGQKLRSELKDAGMDAGEGLVDGVEQSLQIASPSKRMFGLGKNAADSLADGFQQGMADETGKPPLPGNLAAPKPPVTSGYKPSRAERLRARFNDSAIGQGIGRKLSGITGNALTDSQGNVTYDPGTIAGGVAPVRVVNEVEFDPALQNAIETGSIESENLNETLAQQQESIEQNTDTVAEKARQDKAALKESRRQNRQARAGKALAGLGTLTMAAGMATQVSGPVGEIAQKVVGPLAALSGIAPILMALPAPLAALAAVVGLGVGAFLLYNKTVKDAREEAYRLTKALGTGSDALQKYADFTGKARPSEIRDRQRLESQTPFTIKPGETPFGQSFLEAEAGQELLSSVQDVISSRGMQAAQNALTQQLQAALIEGSLTQEQARGIALALGQELNDLNFAMNVNAKLLSIFGPNGEDLSKDPLSYSIQLMGELTTEGLESGQRITEIKEIGYFDAFTSTYEEEAKEAADWVEDNIPPIVTDPFKTIFGEGALTSQLDAIPLFNALGMAVRGFAKVPAAYEGSMAKPRMIAEEVGNYSALISGNLQAFQSQLDAIDVHYDKLILTAEQEGNLDLANQLLEEKLTKRAEYLVEYQESFRDIADQFAGFDLATQADIIKNIDDSILSAFEDDPVQKALAETALKDFGELGLFPDQEFMIKAQVEAGNISLSSLQAIASGDKQTAEYFVDVVANIGGKDADFAMQLAKGFGEDEVSKQKFLLDVATEDPTEALKTIEIFNTVNKMRGVMGDDADTLMSATLSLKQENPAEYDDLKNDLDYLNSIDGKEITVQMITDYVGEEVANIIAANQDYFDSLPADQQKNYAIALRTMFTSYTDPAFKQQVIGWAQANKGVGGLSDDIIFGSYVGDYMAYMADLMTAGTSAASTETTPSPGPGPSGGAEPQVDSLITKLRDLRNATISMKKGWEGMQETLSSIFAGGTNQINVFEGLSNQIRRMGVGENLIEMIVGMDPDEYEKRKNELFVFDAAGNIVDTTDKLKNMNAAFNAVALGEYVNGQQSFIEKTKNQISAIRILTASGLALAEAYEVVQDAATAAAIAQGASAEQIQELIRFTQIAKEEEKKLEKERERSRIAESVLKTNEEFRNQVEILNQLSRASSKYSDEQVKAIMGDSDLQKLFLDPSIDPGALEAALQNAAEKANLEVQIAIAEGREDELFGQYLTEVNDYFSREEAVIGVNFEMDTADESKIIEDAQRQIAAIQYQLDDYNAELEQISWSEEDINEKYDKRVEALDEISDANQKIVDQQKAQLDIADALSKGDIAAAARATAELRSQQASDAQQTQKEQLDRAREAELRALTGPSGMTREQLEDAITALERQVFQLEETALEPAQERVRLAEITRDLAIEQLELNGMTRDEFDQIAASTNLAALNMEDMVKSAEKLVAMGEFIRTGTKPANWEELFPTPKAAPPPPAPAPQRSSAPAPAPAPATKTYTVKPGDSLSKIAAQQGVSNWQAIFNANRGQIRNPNLIYPGQTFVLPAAGGGYVGNYASGGMARRSRSGPPLQMAMGGRVKRYANGGMIIPKRMAEGGYSMGTDIVPAMLTPGEFVVRRPAVSAFGVENLEKINSGTYNDGSVYNYNLAVNVKSDADPNRIARTVMTQIKGIENQRIRGNRL